MKEIKYPVSIFDEPAEYRDFSGGMNTSKNDLSLSTHQIKLGMNLDYDGNTLVVRQGGKKVLEFYNSNLNNLQGVFVFSGSSNYIIVANDGYLSYGLYDTEMNTSLVQLPILINETVYEVSSYKVSHGLLEFNSREINMTQNHDGFIYRDEQARFLTFQNKWKIEAAQYKNKMYVATGTRLVEITEEINGNLKAQVVKPYKPSSIEFTNIGPNLMSYTPSLHIETKSIGPITKIHSVIPLKQTGAYVDIVAVMSFAEGENENDYIFKWERTQDGTNYEPVINKDNQMLIFKEKDKNGHYITKGMNKIMVKESEALAYTYRCSFAISFKRDRVSDVVEGQKEFNYELETITYGTEIKKTYEDYIIDKIDGYWFGQATSIKYSNLLYQAENEYYNQVQSCKKIFGYGNKFLLYDDTYNSGNMWKTVIDNPYYVTYGGGLNFKTDKDEQINRIINFKGILVAFSYNEILGGNISVIDGNGDDYNDGNNYSPFKKRIVNKVISTDNPYSVQVAENIILFKHKTSIYMIEGSDLNYDIIDVQEINSHLKQENLFIKIPFDNNNCITELTDEYYGIYWKETFDSDNDLIHPAYRLKFYYKKAYEDGGRIIIPALIDESEIFNTDFIIQIAGQNFIFHNKKLISFNENHYKDLTETINYKLITRGFELNYPQFIKSVKKIMISYSNDESTEATFEAKVFNEAMIEILKSKKIKFENNVLPEKNNIFKVDSYITNYLLLSAPLREDAMNVTIEISGEAENYLCVNSITVLYKTKSTPRKSPLDNYKNIIRKGERLVK